VSALVAGLWIGGIVITLALLGYISSPRKKPLRRGGFSIHHLLILQSVWEPGKKYVFEEKQKHLEEDDDEGGSGTPGPDGGDPGRTPAA
jgi:hypothetical protein